MIENCPYKDKCNGINCNKDFCMRKYRLDCLYDNSNLEAPQRIHKVLNTDADGTDYQEFMQLAEIEKNIVQFVQEGQNLYIHSYVCGNGKTSWSIRMLQSYFNKVWPKSTFGCQGLFVSVPRFLIELKSNISSKSEYVTFIMDRILTADVVVWDDIATKVGTEFELNHLLNLINMRMDAGKSNIFTSNLGKKELAMTMGDRLTSRIANRSVDIELKGIDKRHLNFVGGND